MLARTRNQRATGNGNGNALALEEPHARDSGPNGPKLSDGGEEATRKAREQPAVRWSALLGACLGSLGEREHASDWRGKQGRCRRARAEQGEGGKRRTEAQAERTRASSPRQRRGDRRASRRQSKEEERLTDSSSATGTGDARLDKQKSAARRCLFAGARG